MELNYALNLIIKGLEGTMNDLGFKVEYPEGVRPPEVPVTTAGEKSAVMYRGDKGRVRIEYENSKLALYCATADEADAPDDDMPRMSLSLLDLNTFEERDLKYIFEEYIDTLQTKYAGKSAAGSGRKMPTPVSKSAAKSGALSYDANTLGNRFTVIYPELRDEYKQNPSEPGVAGVGGYQYYDFTTVKAGTATVTFTYARSWETTDSDITYVAVITVAADLSITAVEITEQ